MKRSLAAACGVFLTAIVIGCGGGGGGGKGDGSGGGNGGGSASGPIRIGAVLELSGGTATYGEETRNGIDMALEKLNVGRERPIEVVYADNNSGATETASAVRQLIDADKVTAIIGAVASTNTIAGATQAQNNKTPMITPGSTNVEVTRIGDYISRVCFIDSFQGPAIARFAAEELKKTKGYLVIDKSADYSVGLADSIRTTFTELGGSIVGETTFEARASDFSALITQVEQAKPDVIFIPAYYREVGLMLKQARGHWDGIPKLGGDGWDSPELLELGGAGVIGTYFATHFAPDDPNPKIQEFTKAYQDKFGKPPGSMSGLGYDAALVVTDAIDRVEGELTKDKLRDAINATSNVDGVTGTIKLDENRNPVKDLVILEVTASGFKFKKKYSP